jgi:hypothetical protein
MTEDDSHGLYGRSVADFIAVVIAVDESSVDHRWALTAVIDATSAEISTCPA